MKKLIVLPGNSPRNQAWGEGCVARYQQYFDEVYMQYYRHWETGDSTLDWSVETEALRTESFKHTPETMVYVLAKSVGSLLALVATAQGALLPTRCVFFGMPLDLAAEEIFKTDWSPLRDFVAPTLAFHNEHDPVANYAFVIDTVATHNPNITVRPLPGDTHDYLDFELYEPVIVSFMNLKS